MAVEEHELGAQRHQRADAARNRARLLEVATEMFRERGIEVGVGEIADRAGVGRGTLFRNFPTKQDLIIAVVVERMHEGIADGRAQLEAAGDEGVLFQFLENLVGAQQADRCLFEVVGEDDFLDREEVREGHAAMVDMLDELIAHDQRLGIVRDGVGAFDVLMLTKGACAVAAAMADAGPQALERHLSFIRAALAAPGRDCPLEGDAPTLADLHPQLSPEQ